MKQTLLALGVILLGTGLAFFLIHKRNVERAAVITRCPTDVMMCPDGTSVPRSGPQCEFGICKQLSVTITKESAATTSLSENTSSTLERKNVPKKVPTNFFSKAASNLSSFVSQVAGSVGVAVSSGIKETSQAVSNSNNSEQPPKQNPTINETRYDVTNNKIVDEDGTVIYVLPPPFGSSSGGTSSSTETHIVNVVPVGTITPIIGAIPVDGLPGKYYLSENTFGTGGGCEFSNKIYILDTTTNTRTLMYEENNFTLSEDDPRACNSEIYLLATENEKLILKYHTINTNMVCESTWSEPEKTWFLDVTKLEKGMWRYAISTHLYEEAEVAETACRSALIEGTTTPSTP